MPKTKYKKQYADDLMEYFLKFIDMRDDPKSRKPREDSGMMYIEEPDGFFKKIPPKPYSGYPTITKFAIKIGVTPRTITNWREKYPAFAEACEFADAIQDDILNERALTGTVDGRVAMKIRELKQNAKDRAEASAGSKIVLEIKSDGAEAIELKKWDGTVDEETDYRV